MLKAALIAPAGKIPKENIALALETLPRYGLDALKGDYLDQNKRYLAANDDHRLHDLEKAWSDESNDLVLCMRGGYGCARLLDKIDWTKLKEHNNTLIGHSDITALHLAFLAKGLKRSISGIMAAAEFIREPDEELTLSSFRKCLNAELFDHQWSGESIQQGETQGLIIPVTLSVLCSLIGSDYLPSFKGAILILEDIGESPYKIDRLLCQLQLAGILDQLSALIFGDFNNCGSEAELQEIFSEYAAFVKGPVMTELPFGHCLPRLNLPVGALAKLEVASGSAKLSLIKY